MPNMANRGVVIPFCLEVVFLFRFFIYNYVNFVISKSSLSSKKGDTRGLRMGENTPHPPFSTLQLILIPPSMATCFDSVNWINRKSAKTFIKYACRRFFLQWVKMEYKHYIANPRNLYAILTLNDKNFQNFNFF